MVSTKEKRTFFEYLDIFIVILNLIVLIFAAFLISRNTILNSLNIIFTLILFALVLITFLRKNPYYISPVYGMVLFGLVLSFGLITVPEIQVSSLWVAFLVVGILDIIFIANMIKGSASSASRVATAGGRIWTLVEPGTDTPTYIKGGKVDSKQKRAIQKKYHMSWIILITLISMFIIFLTLIL